MVLTVRIRKKLKNFTLDLNFSTEAGCMGILGASGSGKSMTLKCIAGIETPDEGIMILDDRILFDSDKGINLKPQERKVGYLFQSYALFPNMTVEENIAVSWKTRHPEADRREITEQVGQMIERFHLQGLEKVYPGNLSGGEQQRTAIARMLLSEPQVMLFDEPFSALDSYLKEGLQAELGRLMQEFGGISLLVTHSRDEVYKLSDTLLVMEQGCGVRHGNTKLMFGNPKDYTTARLTGCKNLSPVTVESENEIFIEEWNLRLSTEIRNQAVQYIGIRAHDFCIYQRKEEAPRQSGLAPHNAFRIQIREITEAPFEWNVMFTTEGATQDAKPLWWKVSKEVISCREDIEAVEMLMVKADGILLLEK